MLVRKLKMFAAISALLLLGACSTLSRSNDPHASSVKVTNTTGNHGGTGIILRSSENNSYVLTNSHVCGVVEKGGIVSGEYGSFLVSGYKKSLMHDLCIIRVSGDLGVATTVASRPPEAYYEKASISGHPGLMPNVISSGHFSGKDLITILVGFRPCTDAEGAGAEDPRTALVCGLLGGMPIIKQYQSTLVTATIMPGSSGSGVYNSDNELSGVAFAGSGELGYAWTVPYEYMKNFLDKEQYRIPFTVPPNDVSLFADGGGEKRSVESFVIRLKKVCSTASREKIKELCSMADTDILK